MVVRLWSTVAVMNDGVSALAKSCQAAVYAVRILAVQCTGCSAAGAIS